MASAAVAMFRRKSRLSYANDIRSNNESNKSDFDSLGRTENEVRLYAMVLFVVMIV